MKKKRIVWSLVLGVMLLAVGATAQRSDLVIKFRHKIGNKQLYLFDSIYLNAFSEPFVVNRLKYYVTNISVKGAGGSERLQKATHLIDESDSISKIIQFYRPNLPLQSIEFTIGVDSAKNFSGVQTGVLDPINGMFWTWNNGYVFAKLEGISDSSTAPLNTFGFHVGGYKGNQNAARKIKLEFNSKLETIKEIIIDVDILKWFNGVHKTSISQSPISHQPGKLAMQLADNVATMFSIAEVK
jgi:hypothetical protein